MRSNLTRELRPSVRKCWTTSRPASVLQVVQHFRTEGRSSLVKLDLIARTQGFGKLGNVFPPIVEVWQPQLHYIDSIEQIRSESVYLDLLFQILICCANQTRIDAPLCVVADAAETSILKEVEKFALQAE